MATSLKNLSDYQGSEVANAADMKFGIIAAEWNIEVTGALCKGAEETLIKHGASADNILVKYVPGTFELSYAAQMMSKLDVDGIIVLGCVIQGETRHFDFICHGVTQGITDLNITQDKPVIFGVLTTENQQQALDRAGGKHGNKGDEAAITAIQMVKYKRDLAAI